jgi:hypothetical protein
MNLLLKVRQFLVKYAIFTLPQSHYSYDLFPPDFFLFPKLRITLKGGRHQTVEDVTNAMNDLKAVPQKSFEQCFQKWKKVHSVQGDYFEGDNIQ